MSAVSNPGQAPEREAPFQLRGNSYTMMVLKVVDPAAPTFFGLLGGKVRQAPNFFRHAPVVLDFEDLAVEPDLFDVGAFVAAVREHHLLPLGFQGGPPRVRESAAALGLVPMPTGRAARLEVVRGDAAQAAPPPPEPAYRPPLIVSEPIRSGQQIYAEKADLIVTASVSAGAEVLADGSIHIYGALRGRALAGVSGEAAARIYCQSLEAELVSIAGLYQVSEDIDRTLLKKPAQIRLDGGYLQMEPL